MMTGILPSDRVLRVRYFQRVRNVGDLLGPYIAESLTGHKIQISSAHEPHLLSIGSMYSSATNQSIVWGTGLMDDGSPIPIIPEKNIVALRGQLTLKALRQRGMSCQGAVIGDPAILSPMLFSKARRPEKNRVGIVTHYLDRHNAIFHRLARDPNVVLLDVCQPPKHFLEKLSTCEHVGSSSLHGLILADSLEIPNIRIRIKSRQNDFKYVDYYSSTLVGRSPLGLDLDASLTADRIRTASRVAGVQHLIDNMKESFPSNLLLHAGAFKQKPNNFIDLEQAHNTLIPVFDQDNHFEQCKCFFLIKEGPARTSPVDFFLRALRYAREYFENWAEAPCFAIISSELHTATAHIQRLADLIEHTVNSMKCSPRFDIVLLVDCNRGGTFTLSRVVEENESLEILLTKFQPSAYCIRTPKAGLTSKSIGCIFY